MKIPFISTPLLGLLDSNPKTEKWLIYLVYSIVAIIFVVLFSQNFLFSSSLNLTQFREIDDLAFQTVIREIHLAISGGNFSKLFQINNYGYGWIFWFPMAIFTYPLYLLSLNAGIDWPLVAAPRQFSLIFSLLSILVLRKILLLRKMPEFTISLTILIFSLLPALGYFSLRFGTVTQLMFFSILSFYLSMSSDLRTRKGRVMVYASTAAAVGTKLNGLFILPLIILICFKRYSIIDYKVLLLNILEAAVISLFFLLLFTNPSFFLAPFYPEVIEDYLKIIRYFMEQAQGSQVGKNFDNFIVNVFGDRVIFLVFLILISGLILNLRKEIGHRFETISILFTLVLCFAYLIMNEHPQDGIYFMALVFLPLLGMMGWAHIRFGVLVVLLILVLLVTNFLHRTSLKSPVLSNNYNHLAYFKKTSTSANIIKNAKIIEQCIGSYDSQWDGHIVVDHRLPIFMNKLSHPRTCITYSWDNLSPKRLYCPRPVDFIILDKNSPGFFNQEDFSVHLKNNPERKDQLSEDRMTRENLEKYNSFNEEKYKLTCSNDLGIIYSKTSN